MTHPDSSQGAYERGLAFQVAGDLERAVACYREALADRRDDHRAMHALGLLALRAGALREAGSLLGAAAEFADRQPDYQVSLGRLLQATGRSREALQRYRRALQIDARHYQARYRLALLLHRTGELEQALDAYEKAFAERADDPALLVNYGALLNLVGRSEDALPHYRKAIELQPGMAAAHGNLANALAGLQRHEEAIAAYERSLELAPDQPQMHANLGSCLLARGDIAAARRAFEKCLGESPGDITSLAMLAALYSEQGDVDAAQTLMDFEKLMRFQPVAPPAQQDLADYLSALREHVLAHPTLKADPFSHTTKQGQQTGSLWPSEDPSIKHLVGQLNAAVKAYIESRPSRWQPVPALPALWPPPHEFQIDMWATVLAGGGHQAPHIHPSGWLSGVFYVDVPMPENDANQAGWIEFGCLPDHAPLGASPATHLHRPRAGELVLFPSYFFHRTVPLRDDKPRISIAFDIIPRNR